MPLEDFIILVISHEKWGDVWYSKHHYANYLSKKNTVLFIESAQKISYSKKINIREVQKNLFVLKYHNIIPFSGKFTILNKINDFIISKKINKYLRRNNLSHKKVFFWSFDLQRLVYPKYFNPCVSLYHIMDSYRMQSEKILAKNVDQILVVSKAFIDTFKEINKKIEYLPHAVPERNFEYLTEVDTLSFFLAGNLNYRVDFEAIYSIAKQYKIEFHIVGPIDDSMLNENDLEIINQLKNLDHVKFEGKQAYNTIEKYIQKASVCFALYKTDYFYSQINSLKIMQYLNYGKPIVCSFFKEYEDKSELVNMSKDNTNFIELVEEALEQHSEHFIEKRLEYAEAFSYPNIVKKIEHILDEE